MTDPVATKDATVAQLALAWLLAQGEHLVPIFDIRSTKCVEEDVGAADLTLTAADLTLTGADLARIREILPAGGFGFRYPQGMNPNWQ